MIQPGDAVRAVKRFFDAYLTQRDIEATMDCLTEEVQWVGTGRSEMVYGREQAKQALLMEFSQAPGSCHIEYESLEEVLISERCAAVLLTASVYPDEMDADIIWFRVSAVCVSQKDEECRIAAVHASTPDSRQEEGEFFPASGLSRFEMEYQLGSRALDIIGRSIPGGMMGAYMEPPDFPLYYINDFLLDYLGYTYEEYTEAIDGKLINCVHPEDRGLVESIVTDACLGDRPYEVQYRMRKKDGSYIWVNDVGKLGRSEDGRDICLSVVRDITVEIESRQRLEEQAEEQKRQAGQYDHLFQSVLCGIVQYRLTDGRVVFIRANREAVRLFGYTEEEFWKIKEWDLAGLVVEEDRDQVLLEARGLQKPGDMRRFEYRVRQKDGTPCWIIGSAEVLEDKEGNVYIQSVYLDIDARKKAELRSSRLSEQVKASNEIIHLALEHTTTCEFYYYPETEKCVVPKRTCEMYQCQELYENMPESIARDLVDAEFRPAFYEMYEKIHKGAKTASCEFRGRNGSFWCRETMSVIISEEDKTPRLVIGIVEDITRQKEAEAALLETRSRDSLTGLYKKEIGIACVLDFLNNREPGDHGVMMLLDMDNFKDINHKEGSIFADAILQEVADILRAESGPDDIQVRLGGDEFMLFYKHSNKCEATVNGPRIAGLVRNILTNTEKDVHVSVSIGMCSTEVCDDYNGLYRCAESTLKYVKENDRGKAACYLDTSNELGVFLTQLYTEEHLVNDIEAGGPAASADLVSFALDLLGKAKNLNDAVFLLLARIGKTYHFDRVSIIEASKAYLSYHFSYQWARNRADLQLGQDFYASEEDFDICAHMYDEDGLAQENVREGISRFPSCLHAGIWNYGEYAGSMSFEVDQEGYEWTKEQRKLLKELVKIVPSFIMKSKADAVSQAKTDFLSRMSHEIRTPMNAISGMTTIAKSVLGDREKTRECLEKIESANTYLIELINDILDMSRIESGKMELGYSAVDLSELLKNLESMFRVQAAEKHLSLLFENEYRKRCCLAADSLRLNQVLVNIIGNAIKFTDQGSVVVRVETLEEEPKAVLRFSVTDTGIGIEEAAMSRIFNAFEQADSATAAVYGGTGLGLSISSRLIQMMGGTLEVRSEVGKGSEFFFTLILDYAKEEKKTDEQDEQQGPVMDFTGCHILLAEDNEMNSEIAKTILEMHGFTVTCVSDGLGALEAYCRAEPGTYDAVLMDIRMPVMDGLESARRIRTSRRADARSIPIIALTANAFDEDTKKSMDSGMDGHLSKPIDVDKMMELLGRCISRNKKLNQI